MSATNRNDGGPAFPARPREQMAGGILVSGHEGMTLRDYFAAKAMQQLIHTAYLLAQDSGPHYTPSDVATDALKYADAMIAARSA